jgi:uncharacterized protein (UPF0335 family)
MGRPPGSKNKPKSNAPAAPRERQRKDAQKKPQAKPAKGAPINALNLAAVEDRRRLFLSHRRKIEQIHLEWATLGAELKKSYRDAKAEGFGSHLFAIARDLKGSEKTWKRVEAEVCDRLMVARWLGYSSLGDQLDLFADAMAQPSLPATPYAEGHQAGMAGERPDRDGTLGKYSIETDQHQEWLNGFYAAVAERVQSGIKPLPETSRELAEAFEVAQTAEVAAGADPARPLEEAAE